MPAHTLDIPPATKKRESSTRYAAQLYLHGGPATDFKPLRNISKLSKLTGVHENTLARANKEDGWEAFALGAVRDYNLTVLPMLPVVGNRLERIEAQLDQLLEKWESCETGSDEAAKVLGQVERCYKMLGIDKRLGTAARLEEAQLRRELNLSKPPSDYVAGEVIDTV